MRHKVFLLGLLLIIVSFVYAAQYGEVPDNKTITINFSYKSGSAFDPDDDGIETVNGAIDLSIEDSILNWQADESKLCTRWQTYPLDAEESTVVCHGDKECCNFVELLPIREEWDEVFYSSYGRYGAALNNIISAQIIYYNVSHDLENIYTEIIISDSASLDAKYYFEENNTINETADNETNITLEDVNNTINETIGNEIGIPETNVSEGSSIYSFFIKLRRKILFSFPKENGFP